MKTRGFEIVKREELQKHFADFANMQILLPTRKTQNSAGYDFYLTEDISLLPKEEVIVKTGIKAYMQHDEVLMIVIRSSLGFKHDLRLKNQVGIIDSDYYSNITNDGHILVALKNHSNDRVCLKKNDTFAQGIFLKYLTVDSEEIPQETRKGGIGSTNNQ